MPSGYTERTWRGEYCGIYEIAEYAGVTKAQVTHWSKEDWFPNPVDEPRMGRIWHYRTVVWVLSERGYPREKEKASKKLGERKRAVLTVDSTGAVKKLP